MSEYLNGVFTIANEYYIIEGTVRETYASVVWSHKIQEKQADIYTKQFKLMETAKIISASLTSVGIVSLIFTDQIWIKIVSALISFVTIFVNAFFKSFDLQAMINNHKTAANKLLVERNKLKYLLLKIRLRENSTTELSEEFKLLLDAIGQVYKEAPNTTEKAVKLAQKALNVDQDNTFSEKEIDSFLPNTLRR